MRKYHGYKYCNNCSGENEIRIVDTINLHVAECETTCIECGFEDYWAHGAFESTGDYVGEDTLTDEELNK